MVTSLHKPHLSYNVPMSMARSQVQRRVIPSVHHIDASPSHDEHVHYAGAALPARPVEWAEAMVISTGEQSHLVQTRKTYNTARN